MGRTIEGLGTLNTASDLAEANGLGATVLRAHINRSSIESTRDPRIGLELGRAALALGRRLGRRGDAEHALRNAARSALQTGDWPWALGEIEADLAEDLEGSHRMSLLEAALQFEALRGDPVADRLEEIRKLAGQSHDRNVLTTVASGEAFAALGAGRLAEARAAWRRVAVLLIEYRSYALRQSAQFSLAAGDAAAAEDDLAELEGNSFEGPAVEAGQLTIRAGLAALDVRPADAVPLDRDALQRWQDLGLVWDEALCGIDMATLLDPSQPEVQAAAKASRIILLRLEATPFVAQLEAAMARRPAKPAGATSTRTD